MQTKEYILIQLIGLGFFLFSYLVLLFPSQIVFVFFKFRKYSLTKMYSVEQNIQLNYVFIIYFFKNTIEPWMMGAKVMRTTTRCWVKSSLLLHHHGVAAAEHLEGEGNKKIQKEKGCDRNKRKGCRKMMEDK